MLLSKLSLTIRSPALLNTSESYSIANEREVYSFMLNWLYWYHSGIDSSNFHN
ncbi:hypothetical protein PN499_08060 [Kamptonema animale CS-326]|uniref:hypothetical protein n=1 Tax=Kamptonema animale TaxID=92934 RepID=UPI00232AA0C5|nr:hypothetical protein [Kamptonema animale]MDB9511133.1 hypothetical protein [Kamptonema animale CS-326]